MPDKLAVWNSSLLLLGERTVDSLTETSVSAIVLGVQWDFALNELLRACNWNWAKKRDELDEVSPVPSYHWSHRYTLPDDFVTLVTLNEVDVDDLGDVFSIEGPYLMTDESTADVEYIAKPTDGSGSGIDANWTTDAVIARMDPLALNALVTLLAAKISPRIAKDGGSTSDALLSRYYNNDLVKARYRNIAEAKRKPMFPNRADSAWVNSRISSTNG